MEIRCSFWERSLPGNRSGACVMTVLSPADTCATQGNGVMFHWSGSAWVRVKAVTGGGTAGLESVSGVRRALIPGGQTHDRKVIP
jgi:hypothetical protein